MCELLLLDISQLSATEARAVGLHPKLCHGHLYVQFYYHCTRNHLNDLQASADISEQISVTTFRVKEF
jgi:hypothetical protein